MGELRLIEAAYGDGIAVLRRLATEYKGVRSWRKLKRSERRAVLDTCRWFMDEAEDRIFSFVGASHVLDVDVDTMRRRIYQFLKKDKAELTAWVKEEAKRIRHEECR